MQGHRELERDDKVRGREHGKVRERERGKEPGGERGGELCKEQGGGGQSCLGKFPLHI